MNTETASVLPIDYDTRIALQLVKEWTDENDETLPLKFAYLQLTKLPFLPRNLKRLSCCNLNITELLDLPDGIISIYLHNVPIKTLDKIPPSIITFFCDNSEIMSLPELPSSLIYFNCTNSPLLIQKDNNESIDDYNSRWRELEIRMRNQKRCVEIKRELMEVTWSKHTL